MPDDDQDFQTYQVYRNGKPITVKAPKGTDPNVVLRDVQHQVEPQRYPSFTPQQQQYPGVGNIGANILQGLGTGAVDPISEAARMIGVEPDAMRDWVESQRAEAGKTYSGRTGEFIGSQWPYAALELATAGTATPEVAAAEAAKGGEVAAEAGEAATEAARSARIYSLPLKGGKEEVSMPPGWTFGAKTLPELTEAQRAAQGVAPLIPRSARAGRIGGKAVDKALREGVTRERGTSAVEDALRPPPRPNPNINVGPRSVPVEAPRTIQQPGTLLKSGRRVAQIIAQHPHIAADIASGTAATGAPTDPNDPRYYGQKAAQFVSGVLAREGLRLGAYPGETLGHLIDRLPVGWLRRAAQIFGSPIRGSSAVASRLSGLPGSVGTGTAAGGLESIVGPWYTQSMQSQQGFQQPGGGVTP